MPPDNILEMPFLRNVGLIMTYRCQVACPHCIIEAGPERQEEMLPADVCDWIQQIASYRNGYVKILSLTGGEPFYNIDLLKMISAFGETRGLLVSAVTNAFWASSRKQAVGTLAQLPAVKMLAISTDVYHQKVISFERVKNAVLAAKECDVPYNISVCTENEEDTGYKEILEKLLKITEMDTINTTITFPAGRALKKLKTFNYQTVEEPPISACSAGSSPVILPDGRIIACIGPLIDLPSPHPLILGSLREDSLQEIFDNAELNSILHAIRIWGPKKLIALIREAGLSRFLPERYIKDSICNTCYFLMSDARIVKFAEQLAKDFEFNKKVAYARVFYLNETEMAEYYQLVGTAEGNPEDENHGF